MTLAWPCSKPISDEWSNISAAREWIRRAEDLLGTLESRPAVTLEARVFGYRARLPKLTIECLPDEILSIILDLATTNSSEIFEFSLTCSRFRSVILHTPSIWEDIPLTMTMPVHFIEAIAQRSGALGLSAYIFSWHLDRRLSSQRKDVLSAIFSLSHRLEDFTVDICKLTAKFVQTFFPSPNFDRVHSFRILCTRGSRTFYREWTMPNLQCLSVSENVPNPSARLWSSAPKLTECEMELSEYPRVGDLVSFLVSIPSLKRLELVLVHLRNSEPTQAKEQIAHLSELKYLKFTSDGHAVGAIARLLRAISCPNLEEMYLEPHFGTEDERDEALWGYRTVARRMRERYPSLKSFELVLGDISYREERDEVKNLVYMFFLDDILWRLPSTIMKITLKATQVSLVALRDELYEDEDGSEDGLDDEDALEEEDVLAIRYPNLKVLNIKECSYAGKEPFYGCLSDYLRQADVALDMFLPSRYPHNVNTEKVEAKKLMKKARAIMRKSGCWKG